MATKIRDTVRREATDPLIVYDMETDLPAGQVINMSFRGLRLMTEFEVEVYKVHYFRMPLPQAINGIDEIFFDAECRWCKQNEETTWYDSGYNIRKASADDAEVIKLLTRKWMMDKSNKLNASQQNRSEKKGGLFSKLFR